MTILAYIYFGIGVLFMIRCVYETIVYQYENFIICAIIAILIGFLWPLVAVALIHDYFVTKRRIKIQDAVTDLIYL